MMLQPISAFANNYVAMVGGGVMYERYERFWLKVEREIRL